MVFSGIFRYGFGTRKNVLDWLNKISWLNLFYVVKLIIVVITDLPEAKRVLVSGVGVDFTGVLVSYNHHDILLVLVGKLHTLSNKGPL